jgi:hypothetical protein
MLVIHHLLPISLLKAPSGLCFLIVNLSDKGARGDEIVALLTVNI